MLSITNLLCGHEAGNERLRYGHTHNGATHQRYPGVPRPVVVWAVTRACNLRCVHCYASATDQPEKGELSHQEGLALLDELRAFDVPAVLFSGGEPLVRPDLLDLIAHAQKLGLSSTLSTNGMLIDERIADGLAEFGLKYVGISLDGTSTVHDRLRGQRGAFEGSLRGLELCRQRGIKVGVRFTVHGLNEGELERIFDICHEQGVERLCIYHLAYAGRGGKMQKVDLTAQRTRAIMDRIFARCTADHAAGRRLEVLTVGNHADAAYLLLQLEKRDPVRLAMVEQRLRGTGGNRSGCNIASIDSVGNVHYDQFSWHYTCGNVRRTPFGQLWAEASDPRLAILRDRREHLPQRCRDCRFVEVCNGNLRTRAEAATGEWLGFDPGCYLTDTEALGLADRE